MKLIQFRHEFYKDIMKNEILKRVTKIQLIIEALRKLKFVFHLLVAASLKIAWNGAETFDSQL